MRIAIVHLSDIHLKTSNDSVFEKVDKIVDAVSSQFEVAGLVIAVSGDIANFGLAKEFTVASDFFHDLSSKLKVSMPDLEHISFVCAPGNHDCNFVTLPKEIEKREAVLPAVISSINKIESNSGLIEQCLSVHQDFFKFLSQMTISDVMPFDSQLFYKSEVRIGDKTLKFNCFNTSLLSKIDEQQGQLYFPPKTILEKEADTGADLVVSLFHHPYNWLESNNSHTFTNYVESTSDLVLTGHEHIRNVFTKEKTTGENLRYFAGDVLQEHGSTKSGFNLVLIDFSTNKQQVLHYKWTIDHYKSQQVTGWQPFMRNKALLSRKFNNNVEFESRLLDTGAIFTHPFKKGKLLLNEIFVYPEIREISTKRTKNSKNKFVQGDNLVEHLLTQEHIVIYGEEYSGKTALAKVLYREFQQRELVPVLIRGDDDLSNPNDDGFRNLVGQAFSHQYNSALSEAYFQLSKRSRVLLIDDFHKLDYLGGFQFQFLEWAKNVFDTIIVFASDVYQLHSIVQHDRDENALLSFSQHKIKEFGRKLRGELIKKWLELGRERKIQRSELSHEERQLEGVLNAIISGNVVPSYPFWILSILQTWNADQSKNGNYGAFGYIYNELITRQLRELGYDPTRIDTIYTILGRIAYHAFDNDLDSLTNYELQEINDQYHKDYRIREDMNELLRKLIEARIFRERDSVYRFTQPYIFYFFAARHIQETLAAKNNEAELTATVLDMIEHISYEPHSYVLLILVYLTKNRNFIERIIENSAQIYSELAPCDLNGDVDFLNRLNVVSGDVALPASAPEENRINYRRQIDEYAEEEEDTDISKEFIEGLKGNKFVKYSSDLSDITKITIGLRNLELMGQILRNFPGSLFGDTKLKLASASYSLGLRILQALISGARENFEGFRAHYKKIIKEERAYISDSEAAADADGLLIWLTSGASFGIIKRISAAVGHEKLQEIYAEVRRNFNSTQSVDLIDLSIKLDHFKGIPFSEIAKLEKETRKSNRFGFGILRDLIAHFLYLFPVDASDRQRLASKFEIKTNDVLLLANDSKRSIKKSSKRFVKRKRGKRKSPNK